MRILCRTKKQPRAEPTWPSATHQLGQRAEEPTGKSTATKNEEQKRAPRGRERGESDVTKAKPTKRKETKRRKLPTTTELDMERRRAQQVNNRRKCNSRVDRREKNGRAKEEDRAKNDNNKKR